MNNHKDGEIIQKPMLQQSPPTTATTTTNQQPRNSPQNGVKYTKTDEGWSWIVAVAASFGTLFVGMSYTLFSLMYQDMAQALDSSASVTGWIGSLHVGCGNLFAVFVSRLIEKFGCRFVCMLGSILTSLGYILSYFAPHVIYMCLSFGVLAGTSTGMMVMSCIVASQQYFTKKRTIAGGLVAGGFSMGSVVGGLLMRFVNHFYPWQYGLVIFAGLVLQMAAISAFAFRPFIPDPTNQNFRRRSRKNQNYEHTNSTTISPDILPSPDFDENENNAGNMNDDFDIIIGSKPTNNTNTSPSSPTREHASDAIHYNIDDHSSQNETLNNVDDSTKVGIPSNNFTISNANTTSHNVSAIASDEDGGEYTKLQPLTTTTSQKPPPARISSIAARAASTTTTPTTRHRKHSIPVFPANLTTLQLFTRLLLFPPLTFYLLSNLFSHVGMTTFLQHSPKRALGFGIKPNLVAMWPVYTALSHGGSKIICGLTANALKWDNLTLYAIALLLTGICQMLIPLCTTYTDIVIQAVIESFFLGCYLSVMSTVVVDLVGIEHVAKSQGLLALFVGIASTLSTPFSGFLFDVTGNYDMTFYVSGVTYAVGFILCVGALVTRRKQHIRNHQNSSK